MTAAEKAEIDKLLVKVGKLLHGKTHTTVNVLSAFLGEIDLAIERARRALSEIKPEEEGP